MARELESLELFAPDPVNPLSDHDLDVFAVANIAPENASAALPATPSPKRQLGLIRAVAGGRL